MSSDLNVIDSSSRAREEVVIAVIGAIGTNLKAADSILGELIRTYGYAHKTVRISKIIRTFPPYNAVGRREGYPYFLRMIEGGNYVCEGLEDNAALARMAAAQIAKLRSKISPRRRRAFIIHSLKRPDEVRLLREIYGSLFYAVGIYSDPSAREKRLTRQINERVGKPDDPEGRYDAQRLMLIDENENTEYGQRVSDTFALADYFVRSDDDAEMRRALARFLTLIFDKPHVSPTRSEVAMMHAFSAGLRSADLSRQIGAVIAARDGRVVTTGCNEVPRPGGGQYWESDLDDNRDFQIGHDMNDLKKKDTIVEMLRQLDSIIMPEHFEDGIEPLYEDIVRRKLLSGTRVDNLIEFGRVSHAEMAALNGALLDAISVRDSDLYCTTFPCHMCSRLIIGAGIRNVYYIEPYPKSAALELYGDTEIRVNPSLTQKEYVDRQYAPSVDDKRTYFLPFEGVAPRRYQDLFVHGKRKNPDGTVEIFQPLTARPRKTPLFIAVHRIVEREVADEINKQADQLRINRRKATRPEQASPADRTSRRVSDATTVASHADEADNAPSSSGSQ